MPKVRRLLVAVDGSKGAERAARHVVALKRSGLDFEVMLLNVQPEWAPPRSREEKREGLRLQLEAGERATGSTEKLLTRAGVQFKPVLRVGDAGRHIVQAARDLRCDAIVMGTRGLGTLAGMILGSVTMKVVQLSTVPVVLVK